MANKGRSGLTVLGIVIGITAIMLVVSIGEGAQGLILGQIQGLGAETIVLRPGQEPKGPTDFAQTLFSDSIKVRELDAIMRKENVPDVAAVAPVVFVSESVAYGGETYRLYLKRSGLHKEWDYDHYKSGTGQYGALGPGEFDYTETRSSAVQPSLKTIQDFGLNEAKLREVQAQLRA